MGRLDHLTDTQGRQINFTYNTGTGLLEAVTDVAGGRTYDAHLRPMPGSSRPDVLALICTGRRRWSR